MPVRLTLHPDEDLDLPDGARLGDLRASLADLTRRPELLHRELTADGDPVTDDSRAGQRPLLPGAVLRTVRPTGPRHRPDPDVAALRSSRFVAATTGSTAGEPLPLVPGAPLRIGPEPTAVTVRLDARGRVRLRPPPLPVLLRTPQDVRAHLVRRTGESDSTGERRRRLGVLPRRWPPDAQLVVARTRYAWHASGDVAAWLAPEPTDRADAPGPGLGMLATGLVPVVGSIALAVAFRQPLYALFSLVAVVALVPQLRAARRRRRTAREPDNETAVPVAGTQPARTLLRIVAAHQASDGAWRRALDTLASRSRTHGDAPEPRGPRDLLPDGALAVRGPAEPVRAAARAVVVDLAAAGATVTATGTHQDAWAWSRWLAPGPGAPAAGDDAPAPHVLVVDGVDPTVLATADAAARRGDVVVLCLPDAGGGAPELPAPSWCRAVLRPTPDGRALRTAPDGTDTVTPRTGVSVGWSERAARRLAGLRGLGRRLTDLDDAARTGPQAPGRPDAAGADPTDPGLPATVPLAELIATGDPTRRWAAATGWRVPLGRDTTGEPVTVDLVADGPHLLVAGTTGAGKSELLQSLILALALTRSPADLALALVDFKGGASFGRCADLPHVVGQVTDLEAGLAGRALAGLRAELHRRERVLAQHRAAALDDAPPGTLPRLVVVIDEFRALADDLPEFLPGLLRLAAQGRSLGVHLVLATQRPAGAVSTDVRANVSTRIALRVVDAADSHDVVETSTAARIPVDRPGRAVLRVGAAPPVVLQCAHAGARPDDGTPVVRRAPRRPPSGPACGASVPSRAAGDPVATTVEAVRRAAERTGHQRGPAPWLEPLPAEVTQATLPSDVAPTDASDGLLLALAEDPDHQRRTLVHWRPGAGHLAVLGNARSGRTTALAQVAAAALDQGWHVHALLPAAAAGRFDRLAEHPGFGTLAGPESPRRTRRLLNLLVRAARESDVGGPGAPDRPRTLVVVDGVAELRAALAGADPWDPLATALADGRTAFALTADAAGIGGLAARTGPRLVLLSADQHADVMLGAPSPLAGKGGPPGRAAWLTSSVALTCQVLLPKPPSGVPVPPEVARSGAAHASRPFGAPLVVRPLPDEVGRFDPDAPDPDGADGALPPGVVIGIGGDDAAPVRLEVDTGALVVGPRGSGRTSALRTIARWASGRGALAAVVARDPGLRADAGDTPSCSPSPAAVRQLVERLAQEVGTDRAPAAAGTSGTPPEGGRGSRPVVVVDDLDTVAQSCPVEAERLGALCLDGAVALVASSTLHGALMAHRGPLAELRGLRHGVVLAAGERGADEVFGAALGDVAESGPPRPGRGALVRAGAAVPVQLAAP